MNFGYTAIKDVRGLLGRKSIQLKEGLEIMIYTKTQMPLGEYQDGQLIQIAFHHVEDNKEIALISFEGYMILDRVMKDGVIIDPELLEGRGPLHVFNVTVAHFLAAKGILFVTKNDDEVWLNFRCGPYDETYRMTEKMAKKVFDLKD